MIVYTSLKGSDMANPHPNYPGEKTVAIRVPERLADCLKGTVIPFLIAQPMGGIVDDILVSNLTLCKRYKLRGEVVIKLSELRSHGDHIIYSRHRSEQELIAAYEGMEGMDSDEM